MYTILGIPGTDRGTIHYQLGRITWCDTQLQFWFVILRTPWHSISIVFHCPCNCFLMRWWNVKNLSISSIEFIETHGRQGVHGEWCSCVLSNIKLTNIEYWTVSYSSSYTTHRAWPGIGNHSYTIARQFQCRCSGLCMHDLQDLDHSSHRVEMVHWDQIQYQQDAQCANCESMVTVWTIMSNQNHRSSCQHWLDRNTNCWIDHWSVHGHPRLSLIWEEALLPCRYRQPRWTRRTCSI